MAANQRQRIAERRRRFGIPSSKLHRCEMGGLVAIVLMRHERDQGEQAQEGRRGASNGPLGPLTLRLDSEMGPYLMERNLHLPAPGKPEQDLDGIYLLVGAQQGLGGKLAQRITNEDPADGNGDKARMVPQGGLGDILNSAVSVTIPAGERDRRPDGRRIGVYLVQGWQTRPDNTGTTILAWESRRRWSDQLCIEA